jgi:N-acetyl-alpha-D-muramate 1-phosphate uridylyltransferase
MRSSAMPQSAMVFAAGLGVRMRPITERTPKPLVRVAGKALIDHSLDRLAEAGVARAVVNVHWLAEQIGAHLAARQRPKIFISDERERLLDQGGGIRKALDALGPDPFFLCNTDAFWVEGASSNLRRLAETWDSERMDAVLLVAPTATSVGVDWPGDFLMTPDGKLKRREERAVAPFVYSGVGIISPHLFVGERRDKFALAPFFFAAAEQGRLFGVRLDGLWMHVGAPEVIREAENAVAQSVF